MLNRILKFKNNISILVVLLSMAGLNSYSQTIISSIDELVEYAQKDGVNVKMKEGLYLITLQNAGPDRLLSNPFLIEFTGSGSTYDFEGAKIWVGTNVFQAFGSTQVVEMRFVGNNNVVKNLTIEDIGEDRPSKTALGVMMDGRANRLENAHLTIRGSHPYGYGDLFGKGGSNVIKHYKHSAILVRGESNHVKNCTVIHRAYGHCIFMQGADKPIVEGCYLEGEMRTTDDVLAEEGTGSPADKVDFMTVWGYKVPAGYMISCQEEGIRAYNAGSTYIDGVLYERGTSNPTVINNTVKHFRGGITQSHARGTVTVSDNTLIGCEGGYSVPDNGTITNCVADVSYGPALGFAYSSDNDANIDITINQLFDTYNGYKSIAYIGGSNHNITLRLEEGAEIDSTLVIKISGDRNSLRHMEGANPSQNDLTSKNITINNFTDQAIVLAPKSSYCKGQSYGAVSDSGVNNNIKQIFLSAEDIEAESTMVYVYPNPVSDQLSIDPRGKNISSIRIYDFTGREYLVQDISKNQEPIKLDFSNLPKGAYFINLAGDQINKTMKVLKQ